MSSTTRVEATDTPPPTTSEKNILTAAKGGSIVFAGSVFEYGSRFVIGIILARFLGAEQFGLYNLALTAATVTAGLSLLGLKAAMVRYVSLAISHRDPARLWGTLQIGLGFTTIVSLLLGGGLYLLAEPIAEQVFDAPSLTPLLQLASLIVPFLTLSDVLAAITRGFKTMRPMVMAQKIFQTILRLVLLGALIVIGLTVTRALVVFWLGAILGVGLLFYYLHKLFSLKRPFGGARYELKEIFRFSLPVYLSDLIQRFGGNLQTVLLGAFNTISSVGIFVAASRINLVGHVFHQSVVSASMPIVSELHGHGKETELARFYQTVTKWTFIVNLPIFLVTLLFAAPILSVFGEDFIGGASVLMVLAWANLINAGTGICGVLLDMSGNTKMKLINSIATVTLTIGLNAILIPMWGLMGAAVATLAAAGTVNLLRLIEVFILLGLLPYNWSFIKPIVASLMAGGVIWWFNHYLAGPINILMVAGNGVILLAIYAGVIVLLGLSEEDRTILAHMQRRLRARFSI